VLVAGAAGLAAPPAGDPICVPITSPETIISTRRFNFRPAAVVFGGIFSLLRCVTDDAPRCGAKLETVLRLSIT
jgi:hypothetical protein